MVLTLLALVDQTTFQHHLLYYMNDCLSSVCFLWSECLTNGSVRVELLRRNETCHTLVTSCGLTMGEVLTKQALSLATGFNPTYGRIVGLTSLESLEVNHLATEEASIQQTIAPKGKERASNDLKPDLTFACFQDNSTFYKSTFPCIRHFSSLPPLLKNGVAMTTAHIIIMKVVFDS